MKTRLLPFVIGLIGVGLIVGCSSLKIGRSQEYSAGSKGTFTATFDAKHRVHELRQFNADHSLKLKVGLEYGRRDLKRLTVFDSNDHKISRSVFASTSIIFSGRDSEIPSPGWEIRSDSSSSGMPGDIHDTISWYCIGDGGEDLLYRVKRTWPDDRTRVYYEVAGPFGVILFTNTYTER
jgi:hypothetical protein